MASAGLAASQTVLQSQLTILLFSLPIAGNGGGWFNTSNGIFTAPITANYLVSFSGSSSAALNGAFVAVQINKISGGVSSQVATTAISEYSAGVFQAMSLSVSTALQAGDTLFATASCGQSACTFQGFSSTGGFGTSLTILRL